MSKLPELSLKTFNCISNFVQDLSEVFEKIKSISLFNRLIAGTTLRDTPAITRYIQSFKDFYNANPTFVTDCKITGNPKISYNDRIYIDVDFVMRKAGKDKDIIYQHLVAIYTVMNINDKENTNKALEILSKKPDNEKLTDSLNLPDTAEGEFIRDSLHGIDELAKEINLNENANPAEMIGAVMQSEFFKNFAEGLQNKFQKGEINAQSLLKTVGGIVSENGMGDELSGMLSGLTGGNSDVANILNMNT